jgi:hypothetical protein
MTLKELPKRIPDYGTLKEVEVIKIVIWWAHTYGSREWVDQEYVRTCYGQIGRAVPSGGFSASLNSLIDRKPPHLLKTRSGYKLEHRVADELTEKYGQRDATIHVDNLLTGLPGKLAKPDERTYLEETLICFRHKAFRAAVVMAWNLAYDHLCHWILADSKRLADFNDASPLRHPKMKYPPVTKREDFIDVKESHVIEIASSANVITTNVYRVLDEKLRRRNMAAHPSDVSTLQPTAEEFIRDIIENVVLKLR